MTNESNDGGANWTQVHWCLHRKWSHWKVILRSHRQGRVVTQGKYTLLRHKESRKSAQTYLLLQSQSGQLIVLIGGREWGENFEFWRFHVIFQESLIDFPGSVPSIQTKVSKPFNVYPYFEKLWWPRKIFNYIRPFSIFGWWGGVVDYDGARSLHLSRPSLAWIGFHGGKGQCGSSPG